MKLMEFNRAIVDLDKCLELDPKYVKAYVKKGMCHNGVKEYHKAKDVYEKGLTFDPNNQELKEGLEKTRVQIMMGSNNEEEQKQRAARSMQDPEIQGILREPEVNVSPFHIP